ncbi:hypothetical protein [Qipengyuania sp. JC766]|uniref:hypothetical protein n=1 Tax=Qipengyuania sp. JC766 TaxID=3232139 RepID=UPI0034586BCF
MHKTIAFCLPALLLAACGSEPGEEVSEAELAARQHVECALGEGSAFAPDCWIDGDASAPGGEFIVRHPDGAFRRLMTAEDGSGIRAIDGADEATSRLSDDGGTLLVTIGADRYRFPARAGTPAETDATTPTPDASAAR